jgi:hypothetical protein
VLSDEHCDALIAGLEARKIEPGAVESAHNLWEAGQPFIDLIDHPMTCSVLREVVAPLLRLETAYSFIRDRGSPALQMHGGRGHAFRYQVTLDTGICRLQIIGAVFISAQNLLCR